MIGDVSRRRKKDGRRLYVLARGDEGRRLLLGRSERRMLREG
jgi:hypothetical protein